MFRKIIEWFKKVREDRAYKKRMKEMRKRDPFIYK